MEALEGKKVRSPQSKLGFLAAAEEHWLEKTIGVLVDFLGCARLLAFV